MHSFFGMVCFAYGTKSGSHAFVQGNRMGIKETDHMEWINVSIFISSTFNDMHAERDLLLKKVFPELSEWCTRRRIRLFDIDLRWGVTTADSQSRNTVDVCLRNIDECRPFFLCFLGQRRGWVPEGNEVNSETAAHYPEITERIGKRSVTEMEIEHALLSPMIRIVEGKQSCPEAAERSLFFIRDDAYLSSLNEAQRKIFTNVAAKNEEETDREHAEFVNRVRSEWSRVYDYTCRFDESLYSTELKEYGEACAMGRLTSFAVQDTPLDSFILEALKQEIRNAYPEREREIGDDTEESEQELQALRAEEARRGTMDRKEITRILSEYCENPEQRILYLHGRAGSGKTTLLSRFAEEQKGSYRTAGMYFCGISPSSMRWEQIWQEIETASGLTENRRETMPERISDILQRIHEMGSALIVIDGVDELNEGLSCLSSLPQVLLEGIRLIVSFRSDSKDAESLISHLSTSEYASVQEVRPLSGEGEITALIHTYLSQYLKALDDDQIRVICENHASENPLFLKILLRELRVFGSFDQLGDEIRAFGETPNSAFARMLENLEQEISYNPIPASEFVPQLAGTLSRVRGIISLPVLKQALKTLMGEKEEDLSDTLSFYIRRLNPYLSGDGFRYGISYNTLRESAGERYASLRIAQHEALAEACMNTEPLESLYHYRMAGNGKATEALSEDLSFLCRIIHQSGAGNLLVELEECARGDKESVSLPVLTCLRQTAALIGKENHTAAALFYKELEREDLRQQARTLCVKPWLRYEPVALTVPEGSETAAFETVFTVEHTGCQGFAGAPGIRAVYLLKGEADIAVCGMEDGTEHASFSFSGNGRLRKLVVSKDGALLGTVTEDLKVLVYRVTLDVHLNLLTQSLIHTDQCASVRFGGISLFGTSNGLIWQRPNGTVVYCGIGTGECEERATSSDKLTGCFEGGTIWKTASGYVIRTDEHDSAIPVSARVNDALLYEGKLVIALENRTITVSDPNSGETIREYPLPAESLGCLALSGDAVYGADRYGALFRLKDGSVEDLGRISQGDNILDTGTQLYALPEGKIAFVSMQRRAVLSAEASGVRPRLFRVSPGKTGVSLFWGENASFAVSLACGNRLTIPYPAYLMEGRNVNETNNLKAACSDDTLIYEENRVGMHVIAPEGTADIEEPGVAEMGGLLCELIYVPETDTFRGTTYKSQYLEFDYRGELRSRIDLPRSDCNLSLLCACGTRSAVLSRRVRMKENPAASAYITDVLSMIEDNRILWSKELSRASAQVTGIRYDSTTELLAVCYTTGVLELYMPESGDVVKKAEQLPVSFLQGAAIRNEMVYSVCGGEEESRLTVRSLTGETACSLVSQRRVRNVIGTKDEILVQEGDETLYRVYLENGD